MGITARTTNNEAIQRELKRGLQTIENGIVRILQMAGEKFVTEAREGLNISGLFPQGDYTDRTANLRSSIGYFVLNNGETINAKIDGTSEGVAAGRSLLLSVPKQSGYQLVGVAGMDYASHVESKGYNVITSQTDIAIVNIERMLGKFKDQFNKKGVATEFDLGTLSFTSFR